MERGEERSIAIVTLSMISIVAVLAAVALFLRQPSGMVMQGTEVYKTADADKFGITCASLDVQKVTYMGSEGRYEVYCCIDDLTGQNGCRTPHRIYRS